MSDEKIVPLPSMRGKTSGLSVARILGVEIISRIENFVLDSHNGNVILHFKDGKIVGYRAEYVVSVK